MDIHIGYEKVAPARLKRTDRTDENAKESATSPRVLLKADKETGRILVDSETTLAGIPTEAWEYKLGNRCALEWILDQYKEKKPKDPVNLQEKTEVEVLIPSDPVRDDDDPTGWKAARQFIGMWKDATSGENVGEDHDKYIYRRK